MIRAIIVDDEPAVLDEMKDMLEAENGFDLVGAYTEPLKALDEAGEIMPECALLDIEMMGMSGIELAERLLHINPNMEIIFVTAYNNYAAQAFEVDAIDYILKPVRAERLKKTLERLQKRRINNHTDKNVKCTVRSFGDFEVAVGKQIIRWKRSKTKELFAYLLHWQGRSVTKYKLCGLLWPEHSQEQSLAYLQTSIWAIRKSFRDIDFRGIKIEYYNDRYFISLEDVSWDVPEFEKRCQKFEKSGSEEERSRALSCYRGDYLEGEDWLWAYADRERYRRLYKELNKAAELIQDV